MMARSASFSAVMHLMVGVAVIGCGSSGHQPRGGPLADPAAAQDVPANPQAALLNGEVPLPNNEGSPTPSEEPLPNPEQAGTPSGGGVASRCSNVCVGVGGNCADACVVNCSNLVYVTGPCAGAISAFIDCAARGRIVCRDNGDVDVSDATSCLNQALGVTNCFTNSTVTQVPSSDNSGPGRGSGR